MDHPAVVVPWLELAAGGWWLVYGYGLFKTQRIQAVSLHSKGSSQKRYHMKGKNFIMFSVLCCLFLLGEHVLKCLRSATTKRYFFGVQREREREREKVRKKS